MSVVDALWRLALRAAYRPRRALLRRFALGRGGALVAVRTPDRLLVVRHSYRPGLDLIGGGIARGETPEAAARRELREEVGLLVPAGVLRPLGSVRTHFGGPDSRNHVFEWRVERLPDVRIDNRELVWAGAVRPREVPKAERGAALRWYLRRHAPDLDGPLVQAVPSSSTA